MKLPPLVVTLAMSNILQGVVNVYTAGHAITGRPSPVLQIIAAKTTGIFPNVLFLLAILAPIVMVILYRTKWGMKLFGAGANETAAYLSGVNVRLVRCTAFIVSGVLAEPDRAAAHRQHGHRLQGHGLQLRHAQHRGGGRRRGVAGRRGRQLPRA